MTHFMQCFDLVVAFYCENYATKSAEKQKRDAAKVQHTDAAPLQFHMEPMEVDQNATSSSTTTTTTSASISQVDRTFEEELGAVETTLIW
jgi:hypothetical protein